MLPDLPRVQPIRLRADRLLSRTRRFKNKSCKIYDTSALVVTRLAVSGATWSVTATISSPNVVLTRFSALIFRYPPPLFFPCYPLAVSHSIGSRTTSRLGETSEQRLCHASTGDDFPLLRCS